ncbi:MAG: hypothetical protein RIB98_00390 [Acidimicrobiales bacterium]
MEEAGTGTSRIVELSLRENAYDFLNESLRFADRATSGENSAWKFAIVLASQAVELLLKARLEDEHPLLVLANPDKGNSTATVDVPAALARLAGAGANFDAEDVSRLHHARRMRNQFAHYNVRATVDQLEAAFADLMEFAHVFHLEQLNGELHDLLDEDVYGIEAAMMDRFRRSLLTYQGSEVSRSLPLELLESQFALRVRFGDVVLDRIRCGAPEDILVGQYDGCCGDCSAVPGQLHVWGCDIERCPECGGQMLSCDCDAEWEWADEIDEWRTGYGAD